MRQAGTIATQSDAQRFADYLLALGITSKVEPSGDQWAIWVHDENQLQHSREELQQFKAEPNNARYKAAAQTAKQARREAVKKTRQAQRNYVDMRNEWANPWHRRPVTMALIVFSALVFLNLTGIDKSYLIMGSDDTLCEVREGEVWRLVTPIFMHGGPLHIVFNMFWLYDLGTLIERKLGSIRYLFLVLVIAVVSNLAQFVMSGPFFGGMSGVVYGLFGYAWIRGRLDPTCGLYLRPDIVFWMLGWFALCAAGVIGGVANWAHGGGLASGAALGYLAYAIDQLRRRRR
jgi:GlpG protein